MPPHSDATAAPAPAARPKGRVHVVVRERSAEKIARSLLVLTLITSFYVQIEPAPTDVIACLFTICAFIAGARPATARRAQLVFVLVVAFLGSLAVSSFFIVGVLGDALRSAAIDIYLWLLMLALVIYVSNDPDRRVALIMKWWIVAACLATIITLLAHMHVLPGWETYYRDASLTRLRGTFKDPNVFGPYLVPPAFFAVHALMTSRRNRLFYTIALLLCLYGVIAPLSRGAWGNFIVAAVVTGGLVVLRADLRQTMRGIGVLAVLVVAGILTFLANPIDLANTALGSRTSLQDYDTSRLETILLSIDMIGRHPLGVGPYQSEVYFPGTNAHNLFVAKTFEAGIVAGVSLLLLTILAFWRSFTAWWRTGNSIHAIFVGCLTGWFINSMVIYSHHWRHTFVVLALCLIPPLQSTVRRRVRRAPRPQGSRRLVRRNPPAGEAPKPQAGE